MAVDKGVFCISFDTELVWGRHDKQYLSVFLPRAKRTRPIIKKILQFLEKNKIGATWAIVGHLFLSECKKVKGRVHPEIVRPNYNWYQKDWYITDPGTNISKNPEWYGKDIVKLLKKTKFQEIGSHSFSHLIFGDKGCSVKAAETDLSACIELAKKENIKFTSFVFPRNKIGHLKILKKYGFVSFRGNPKKYNEGKTIFQKIVLVLDLFLPTAPVVSSPTKEHGLVNIPASFYFPSGRGKRKNIPANIRYLKAKRGIDEAIRQKKVFHLWAHPIDFVDDTNKLIKDFRKIIDYALEKRDEGKLDILTMNEIAKRIKN